MKCDLDPQFVDKSVEKREDVSQSQDGGNDTQNDHPNGIADL